MAMLKTRVACPVKYDKFPKSNVLSALLRAEYSRELEGADIVLAGVPFDLAVSNRSGTRFGPKYLRSKGFRSMASDPDLNISLLESLRVIDYGDFELARGYLEDGFAKITEQTTKILDAGAVPVLVGGDHAISLPELKAYYLKYGPMAVVHFDSHLDTGVEKKETKALYSHGNPFSWAMRKGYVDGAHTIQIGIRGGWRNAEDTAEFTDAYGREFILARDLHYMSYEEIGQRIREKVGDRPVFVTFDIDFLDPAYAPGTGTPVVGGFSVHDAIEILEAGLLGLDIKGADLVEVMPTYDPGELTANAASAVLQKLVSIIGCNLTTPVASV
jgi:agmatinase